MLRIPSAIAVFLALLTLMGTDSAVAQLPGPAPLHRAAAAYNPSTREIIVSVNSVLSWYVESASGSLTGAEPLFPSIPGALHTNNDARVGQASFGSWFSFQNQNLGAVAALGLPLSDLLLRSWHSGGSPELEGTFVLVPEPSAVMIVALTCLIAASRPNRWPRFANSPRRQ